LHAGPHTGLKSISLWVARQYGEDASKGSLETGKRADMVILSKDPTAVDPTTIADIKVLETIKDGRTIYTRGKDKPASAGANVIPFLQAMADMPAHEGTAQAGERDLHDLMFEISAGMAAGGGAR
jgi:adenine deaminase